jgi:D-arabinose 1-dehydrogenase-like Zn-dependent alcohol dehydrogenase
LESSKNECGFLRWLSRIEQINEAFERLLRQDVKYRFVIDMSSLK